MRKNKRGQITIFIILALIIVFIIALFFLLRKPPNTTVSSENPNLYIQTCVKGPLEKEIDLLSKQGGEINPKGNLIYENEKVSYLCYTSTKDEKCTNQNPMLIEHIEEQLKDYITPQINSCFEGLRIELEKKGEVELGSDMEFNLSLKPKQVIINIDRDLRITKGDSSQNFKEFNIKIINPIFNLVEISNEIVNDESQSCDFDLVYFMTLNRDYGIKVNQTASDDMIYTVTEKASNKNFRFAIRNCPT
jgi:hypothetical protein